MKTQTQTRNIRIGELLKELGYIDDDGLNRALLYQQEHRNVRLGTVLIELGLISEDQVLDALGKKLDLPVTDISIVNVDINAVRMIPQEMAQRACALCVSKAGNVVHVITNDPLNFFGLEEIQQVVGMPVEISLCNRAPLERAIAYYYREASTFLQAEDASLAFESALEVVANEADMGGEDAPIVALLNQLIQYAYAVGASDVHVEPCQDSTRIRVRVDGVLSDYLTIKRSVHAPLITRIKIVSNIDIAERFLPQDGHFHINILGEPVNIRVSVIPTAYGEKAALRLLASSKTIDRSTTFGMRQDDYEKYSNMLSTPNGIVFLTGPTGSGKTTTLYMTLASLANDEVNISTIEDPIERNLPRITQMQVNEASGLTFATGLRALMRQDPDIIMLGETRDEETASIAVRAAITGHLVLSTLHTNDAASSIRRLMDMGVEPYMISSSLAGIVAQRLMRKVCPKCSETRLATESELELLGRNSDEKVEVRSGRGCHHCNNTGYLDRMAIHEILKVDRGLRRLINAGASDEDIRDYAVSEQGMKTLRDAGIEAVIAGETSMEELMKIVFYA